MPTRHNKTGRSKVAGRFVMLEDWLLTSPAWLSLSPAVRVLFIELMRRYNGQNNGRIALSVRDAVKACRITKDTAGRAFHALEDRGFIERAVPGGFSRKVRHATEWRLTHRKCDRTGASGTRAFMRWRPPLKI